MADWAMMAQSVVGSVAAGLGMYWGFGAVMNRVYYRGRAGSPLEWKCQPGRQPPEKIRRRDRFLGTANLTVASVMSGLLVYHIKTGGYSTLYFDLKEHSLAGAVLSTVVYFLLTDMGLYWAHRLYHHPLLFKPIHLVHHRNPTPDAFTAMAMHPIEFATYQSIMLVPMFLMPLPAAGVIATLLYQNYVALVDHSGVRLYSIWPWQPPSQFHDDHHRYFHVNYGQNMGLWDRVFGTYRRQGRKYGPDVFGGQGEGAGEAPLVDYSREAVERQIGQAPAGAKEAS